MLPVMSSLGVVSSDGWMDGCRSSSDDSAVGGGGNDIGGGGRLPPPEAISLDRSFNTSAEEFTSAWDTLRTCASFRYSTGGVWPPAGPGGAGEKEKRCSLG